MNIMPKCMKSQLVSNAERRAWRAGFNTCLDYFSIWDNSVQRIGSNEIDIRDIKRFLDEELAEELEATETED